MRLFFDEDLGKGVSVALDAVGVESDYVGPGRAIRKGTPDEVWIPRAGRAGWLVVTANTGILRAEAQREVWTSESVGGVFLTSGRIRSIDLLRLILRKLDWMDGIDRTEKRPFAFTLSLTGKTTRVL